MSLSGTWRGVTYGNGKFVATGNVGAIAYSTDGVNWTQIKVGNYYWNNVICGGE